MLRGHIISRCAPAEPRRIAQRLAPQDWSYIDRHTFELTLELSPSKWPPAETLDAIFNANLQALLALPMTAAFGGLRYAAGQQHSDGQRTLQGTDPSCHHVKPACRHAASALCQLLLHLGWPTGQSLQHMALLHGRGFVRQQAAAAAGSKAGAAIAAEIRVDGVDSYVTSGAQFGDFYR